MSARVTKADQFVADMKCYRGMDWVRLGIQVEVDGDLGTIVGMNSSANLDVVFVNQLKMGKHKHNCHPTWKTRYFDADGKVIRDFCGTRTDQSSTTTAAQAATDAENGGEHA